MGLHRSSVRRSGDIRTLAGKSSETFLPHRALLRIACLEMEKFRRAQERASALGRVRSVDQRFEEIRAEQSRLFRSVGLADKQAAPTADSPSGARGMTSVEGGKRKFRY